MSKQFEFTLRLHVDEEALAAHDGEKTPPPNDVEDWDASDLLAAERLEIVSFSDGTLERIQEVPEE